MINTILSFHGLLLISLFIGLGTSSAQGTSPTESRLESFTPQENDLTKSDNKESFKKELNQVHCILGLMNAIVTESTKNKLWFKNKEIINIHLIKHTNLLDSIDEINHTKKTFPEKFTIVEDCLNKNHRLALIQFREKHPPVRRTALPCFYFFDLDEGRLLLKLDYTFTSHTPLRLLPFDADTSFFQTFTGTIPNEFQILAQTMIIRTQELTQKMKELSTKNPRYDSQELFNIDYIKSTKAIEETIHTSKANKEKLLTTIKGESIILSFSFGLRHDKNETVYGPSVTNYFNATTQDHILELWLH